MKSRIRLSAVLALAAIFPAIVQADTLSPARGRKLDLGAFNGVAYYTVETSGFRVVATVARGGDTPVRLEAVLAPGQSMILSSPKSRDEEAARVEITRREDALHLSSLQ
jgi:hypothetical protein